MRILDMKQNEIEYDLVRVKQREKRVEIPVYDKGEGQLPYIYYVLKSDGHLPELYHIMDDLFMDKDGNCYFLFDDCNG